MFCNVPKKTKLTLSVCRAWFSQVQLLMPLFTQWWVLSGIVKSESHPLEIRVCVSPALSFPSLLHCLQTPDQPRATPKAVTFLTLK